MASTSSNTNVLNTSRARQRRKTRKESISSKRNSTLKSENTINSSINEEDREENGLIVNQQHSSPEPNVVQDQLTINASSPHNQSEPLVDNLEVTRVSKDPSNATNGDVHVLSEPSPIFINVEVNHATPIKAKLLSSLLTIRLTFVNEISGLPLEKSSQQISAVSFYENRQNIGYIMPIITKPAKIESTSKGRLIARWNEDVVFCETKEHILEGPRVALLLELLVLPITSVQPPCPIAWGIILPSKVSLDEVIAVQLHRIPKRIRTIIKSSDLVGIQSPTKYPSVVYIKISVSSHSPLSMEPGLRSVLPTMPEVSQRGLDHLHPLGSGFKGLGVESVDNGTSIYKWARLPGQSCAIPDKLMECLTSGSDGCSALAFGPSGRLLATACINRGNQVVIKIHQLLSTGNHWYEVCNLQCGAGIVYECVWSQDESRLACASASGICHLWTLSEDYKEQLMPHPSYVYTLQWVMESTVIITGCYDGAIRCWKNGELLEVILAGNHRINTLCYDGVSNKLYSGAVNGCISVWNIIHAVDDGSMLQRDRVLDISSIKEQSVQKLILITGQQRLIVHALNSPFMIVDLRLDQVTHTFQPSGPIIHPCVLCVSPCGNLLFTSNADSSVVCIWNMSTGDLVREQQIKGLHGPLSAISYHPFDHIVACSAIGSNRKITILTKH